MPEGMDFFFFFFFQLLYFRTKFNVSSLVLDMKKFISSQRITPFCMFSETHFMKTHIFIFSLKTSDFHHWNGMVS